ncbi:cyanophycin synthetase [Oxobacter pfennigii]|uniref:Cyanophycin synthetase n=1 Tax=Oxobacter pfennigii TaxID=36849 RepID=A0A0P8W7D8_9CLOT|nr:cyanophycin synthetase [Oxobacter pfennigii]KPU44573.1 cyanophycin synthetase [Oxobacter pfennigii]
MHIKNTQVYCGRNIHSHKPVIKMTVDLEEYYDTPTIKIPGFNERLIQCLPGLKEHKCSLGIERGFLKRLSEGTYLAHVAEHSILELQNMLGFNVKFGRARATEDVNIYEIVYQYEVENTGILCGELIIDTFNDIISGKDISFMDNFLKLKKQAESFALGPSTDAIYKEALKRKIPLMRIGDDSILQLGYGRYMKRVEATLTENTSCVAVDIACDKALTKKILKDACLPVAEGYTVKDKDDALYFAKKMQYPVVIKPKNGNQGKGVCVNLNSDEEVIEAYDIAKKISQEIMVEKFIEGKDYRVLVVGDTVAAVALRIPPFIIGDGMSSIKELVDIENKNPKRGCDHEKVLTKIQLDDISVGTLKKKNMSIDTVLKKGQKLYLRENANLSTGATAKDCTDIIHPLNAELAIKAAKLVGLDIAGVDITTFDIGKPIIETGGVIIEVNAAPGIRMHHYPAEGKARDAAKAIVDMLYPKDSKYSIPIVSVTGTNGKTTTTRMIAHILSLYGYNVGMTTTSGIYINNKCVLKGDTTGPVSARTILSDKNVEAAVLETARGGIVRLGLGYDLADVGIITNISDDHLGLDNINTLEDMAFVKSLVAESVKDEGYAVLNADDHFTPQISERVKSNIIYFSINKDNIILKKHLKEGRISVYVNEGAIYIAKGEENTIAANIADIPSTMDGRIAYNVENCLAAISACVGLNIPVDVISMGLKTFYLNEIQNPGRFNVYNVGNYRVLVDYGHNVAGYKGVLEAAKKLGASRLVGVIGVPGDRSNENAVKIGRIAADYFDYMYIKEDSDLRGRSPGEIAKLLEMGAISGGKSKDSINIILSEEKALDTAMNDAKPGDLIIVFYEKLDGIVEVIKRHIDMEGKVRTMAGISKTMQGA